MRAPLACKRLGPALLTLALVQCHTPAPKPTPVVVAPQPATPKAPPAPATPQPAALGDELGDDWCGTGKVLAYEFVTAQRQFGHKLLAQLSGKAPGNLILSPTSLHLAFLMAREGAGKDTLKGINTALSLPADRDNVSAVVPGRLHLNHKLFKYVAFNKNPWLFQDK